MLHNPSTLFSGGNVVLDNTPYLRIAMQQQAKQKAMDEAAFRHYSELPDRLNSAGVRDQDWSDISGHGQGSISDDIGNTKNYFMQNAKDIIKGAPASIQFSKMMQNNMRQIQSSKDQAKEQLQIGKEALKPNGWRARESDAPIIHNMDASIYDNTAKKTNGSRYGINDLSIAVAPYTPQIEMAHNKNITNGIVPVRDVNDKGVIDETAKKVTYNKIYSPEKLKQIGLNASTDAANNSTLGNKYEDMLNNKEDIQRATDAGKSIYGNDFIADTKEKMAAGTKIAEYSKMKIPETLTDVKSLQDWRDRDREDRQAAQLKLTNIKEAGKNARTDKLVGGSTVNYPLNDFAQKYGKPAPKYYSAEGIPMGTAEDGSMRIYIKDLPQAEYNIYNRKDKNGQMQVDPIVDPHTQDEYFNIKPNLKGNIDLEGQNGVIESEFTRQQKISSLPKGKAPLGLYMNRDKSTSKPIGAAKIHWK